MLAEILWFFQILPYHPPPRPFESFSGYIIRLFEANGITELHDVRLMTEMDLRNDYANPEINPVDSFGLLPEISTCTLDLLHATTFYHLARKFNITRKKGSRANIRLKKFLLPIFYQYLRFCSLCLQEIEYYSLLPQFSILEGCATHGCLFQETCPFCQNPIQLLPSKLGLGICPHCKFDLRTSEVHWLSDKHNIENLKSRQKTLEFLIAPHPDEQKVNFLRRRVGRNFFWLRESNEYSLAKLLDQTQIPMHHIYGMEYLAPAGHSANGGLLNSYFTYSDFWGYSLEELFEVELIPTMNRDDEDHKEKPIKWLRLVVRGQIFVSRVKRVVDQFLMENREITLSLVAKELEIKWYVIRNNHTAYELVKDAQDLWLKKNLARLVESMQKLFDETTNSGLELSLKAVCNKLGISHHTIEDNEILSTLYKEYNNNYQKFLRREQRLLAQAKAAIDELLEMGTKITVEVTAKTLGANKNTLSSYPLVIQYVYRFCKNGEKRQREYEIRENYWLENITTTIQSLLNQQIEITRTLVADILGRKLQYFYQFSKAREILQQLPDIRGKGRESLFVKQIQNMFDEYHEQHEILEFTVIAARLNSQNYLDYSKVRKIYEEIRNYNNQLLIVKDLEYKERLTKIAQNGDSKNKTVEEIIELVGLDRQTISNFPKSYAFILQLAEEKRRQRLSDAEKY